MIPERFEKASLPSVPCNISYGIRDFVGHLFTHERSYVRRLDIKSAGRRPVGSSPRRATCRRENFVRCLMTIDTDLSSCQSYRYHSVGDSMEGRGRQPRQTLLWCSYQAIQPSIQPTRPYKLPHTRVRVGAGACSKLALRRFVARIYLQLSIYVPVYARNRAITAGVSRLRMPEEMLKSWPPHSSVKKIGCLENGREDAEE